MENSNRNEVKQKAEEIVTRGELSRYENLSRFSRVCFLILTTFALGLAIFYVFNFSIRGWVLSSIAYYYLIIALYSSSVFLILPARKKDKAVPWYDWVAASLTFGISIYFFLHDWEILHLGWTHPSPFNFTLALILSLCVLEGGRRMAGSVYTVVCLLIGLYPVFAGHMPNIFFGSSFSLIDTVGFHVFGSEGMIGLPTKILGELLIGFLLFAGVLITSGAGKFFVDFALATCGRFRGGPAKVSVLSSSLFGTVSGSAVANVVADGPVTIPTMIGVGFAPHHAAAIEAVTSTGGILMPPVMGAVAFVMAAFLGIEYREVCIAAALPAILYYLGLLMQIDAYAAKAGLKGLPREKLPSLKKTLKMGWPFLAVIAFLIWGLLYMGWETYTPYYASLLMFFLSFCSKETMMTPKKIINTFVIGGTIIAQTMAVMLPIGFIIAGLTVPGTSASFTSGIVNLAGGNVLLILILGAVACYILGMAGMMVSAYIFLAVTFAPAVIQAGHLNTIAVHLFIIYYCMVSVITPPVAVAAFVAAAIAGADPMKTGLKAMRLGVTIYFIPFFFIYNPALIFQGPLIETLHRFFMCVLGLILIAAANEGYLWIIGKIGWVARLFLFISGLLFAFPESKTDLIGFVISLVVIVLIFIRRKINTRKT